MTTLRNPTPGYPASSRYGPRQSFQVSPGVWTLPFHYGDDHTAPGGTPIVSVLPGKVIRVGYDNNPDYEGQGIPRWPGLRKGLLYGGGYWIFIQTGNLVVRYMHMARPTHLKVGDSVNEGQQIGFVGTTGVSTGNHLHIETLVDGKWVDPMLINADHYKPKRKSKVTYASIQNREKNRKIKVGETLFLVDSRGAKRNLAVHGPGDYQFNVHVHVRGLEPGATLGVRLDWEKPGGKPSTHYPEYIIAGNDGVATGNVVFNRPVPSGTNVFARVTSSALNKKVGQVQWIDVDSLKFD